MSILNKNIVKITSEDLKDANLSSAGFNEETQKRAFANILGARLAIKLLFSKKIEANNIYSLYTIQSILKNLDVSDIYFENIKIDVRLVFNKNEIFIPKSHFEYDILPDIYIPLLLKSDMSSAEILGFFEPKEINKSNENKEFYFFEAEKLHKPESLKKFINLFIQKTPKKSKLEELQRSEDLFVDLIDDEISEEDKLFLIQQLNNNIYLREKLVELENFELLSKNSVKEEIFSHDLLLEAQEEISEEVPEEQIGIYNEEATEQIEDSQKILEENLSEDIISEISDLEETVNLDALDIEGTLTEPASEKTEEYQPELVPLAPLEESEEIQEPESAKEEGSINADDFDFGMFESAEEKSQEEIFNLEDLDNKAEEILSQKPEDEDEDGLKSKIDELLDDLEEKDINLDKIEIIEDLVSKSDTNLSDIPDFESFSADELEFISPEQEPETDKKDKDLINILFEKENIKASDEMETLSEPSEKKISKNVAVNKKVIIAASIAGLMIFGVVGGILITKQKSQISENNILTTNQMNPDMATGLEGASPQDITQIEYQQGENMPAIPPPTQYQNQGRDMSKAVSEAFMSTPINATVSKIAWEAPEDLAYNDSFRKYLQMAGKNLKLTLQNDLLLSSEMAYSNKVIVDITMNKSGTLKDSKIAVSSGSKQIDNIVLQSVKETLKYLKMPSDEIQSPSVDLTLIINF